MPLRMSTAVRSAVAVLFAAAVATGLSACGASPKPVPVPPVPANILTVTLNNDGTIDPGKPEFVTDKPAAELRLIIKNHGGNDFKDSPMDDKIVNVANLTRTDLTQPMKLGSVTINRLSSVSEYGGYVDVLLPLGTYELQLDGKPTGAKLTISPVATPKSAAVAK